MPETNAQVYPQANIQFSFRRPWYDTMDDTQPPVFSHFVYPECSQDFGEIENRFTLQFDTPEQAIGFLKEQELYEEAVEDGWLLVAITTTVLSIAGA